MYHVFAQTSTLRMRSTMAWNFKDYWQKRLSPSFQQKRSLVLYVSFSNQIGLNFFCFRPHMYIVKLQKIMLENFTTASRTRKRNSLKGAAIEVKVLFHEKVQIILRQFLYIYFCFLNIINFHPWCRDIDNAVISEW